MKFKKMYLLIILVVGAITLIVANETSSYSSEATELCDRIREAKASNIRQLESEKAMIESMKNYTVVADEQAIRANFLNYAEIIRQKINDTLVISDNGKTASRLSSKILKECILEENSYDYMLARLNNCISAISIGITAKSGMTRPNLQDYAHAESDFDKNGYNLDIGLYMAINSYDTFVASNGNGRPKPECRI